MSRVKRITGRQVRSVVKSSSGQTELDGGEHEEDDVERRADDRK